MQLKKRPACTSAGYLKNDYHLLCFIVIQHILYNSNSTKNHIYARLAHMNKGGFMKLIKILRRGMIGIAEATVDVRNYPELGGFQRDNDRLSGDVKKVGNDLRKAIKSHGSSYKRTSTT